MVQVGKKVSNFTLPATGESGEFQLSEALQSRRLILWFYPKDSTPGCTREGQAFRDHHDEFAEAGVDIIGVSRDTLASHERFRDRQDFPFHLISDRDEVLCRQFDVIKEKNMYGRKVMGIERSTFLIDETGTLVREWRKVRVPGHVEEVLDAVREL